MVRKDKTVTMKVHVTNKAIIETIATRRRLNGQTVTNDEVLFDVLKRAEPMIVGEIIANGAEVPRDKRKDKKPKE